MRPETPLATVHAAAFRVPTDGTEADGTLAWDSTVVVVVNAVGFFDWEKKDYRKIPVREQVEVVSFVGDVALGPDGNPAIHVHVVVSRSDGTAICGHLLEAHVCPTLEVVVTESPKHLHKRNDPKSGLALIVPRD